MSQDLWTTQSIALVFHVLFYLVLSVSRNHASTPWESWHLAACEPCLKSPHQLTSCRGFVMKPCRLTSLSHSLVLPKQSGSDKNSLSVCSTQSFPGDWAFRLTVVFHFCSERRTRHLLNISLTRPPLHLPTLFEIHEFWQGHLSLVSPPVSLACFQSPANIRLWFFTGMEQV